MMVESSSRLCTRRDRQPVEGGYKIGKHHLQCLLLTWTSKLQFRHVRMIALLHHRAHMVPLCHYSQGAVSGVVINQGWQELIKLCYCRRIGKYEGEGRL
jgi:hypothetical protein